MSMNEQVGGTHYQHLEIQPAEYCQRNRLSYCESAVVKYVSRHRHKNGRQDLEKAIHCLQMLIAMEYPVDELPPQSNWAQEEQESEIFAQACAAFDSAMPGIPADAVITMSEGGAE